MDNKKIITKYINGINISYTLDPLFDSSFDDRSPYIPSARFVIVDDIKNLK